MYHAITEDNRYGGSVSSMKEGINYTEIEPNLSTDIWNGLAWLDGRTQEEIRLAIVPNQISRMKFIIQVFITTGIMYEDIVLFIQNMNFDEAQKYVILTRLRSATHFDRYSNDLLTIAQMMVITSEQLDEIFINGNLLD